MSPCIGGTLKSINVKIKILITVHLKLVLSKTAQ